MPREAFEVRLTHPAVYDYDCMPHERSGMAGRIMVSTPDDAEWEGTAKTGEELPEAAVPALPDVDDILNAGRIAPEE